MTPEAKAWLHRRFGNRARFDEPMARHTSFRVGGLADAFVMPRTDQELADLLQWGETQHIAWLVMGKGSNLLIKDHGFRGCVVALRQGQRPITRTALGSGMWEVCADARIPLARLCGYAISNGLAGLNSLLGIPGTVGGAVIMNAGTARGSIGSVLHSVKILTDDWQTKLIKQDAIDTAYRKMRFKEISYRHQPIVLEARFRLQEADGQQLRKEARELMKKRKQSQPLGYPSAGCVFKNPVDHHPAGKLIEDAGLKGKRIGGACVSHRHANFIINEHHATATDVLALMDLVKETVLKVHGIDLEPEIQIVH